MSETTHIGADLGVAPVTSFSGEYRFLANPYPCAVWYEGISYRSAEHAFQAAKTLDWEVRARMAAIPDWREAKACGRKVTLRPGWDQIRGGIMLQVVAAKFTQNPELAYELTATDQRVLLEGNHWGDTGWGAVPSGHAAWSEDLPWWHQGEQVWAGHNWLGLALMYTREMLFLP